MILILHPTTEKVVLEEKSKFIPFTLAYNNNVITINSGATFCGNTATFNLSGATINSVKWYSDSLGTNLINTTGATYDHNISTLSNGTHTIYYNASNSNGCNTGIQPVIFTKDSNSGSAPGILAGTLTQLCSEDNSNIELSGYNFYEWRESDVMGNMSSISVNSNSFTNTTVKNHLNVSLATGNYKYWYRGRTTNNCFSPWTFIEWEVLEEVGAVNLTMATATNVTPRSVFCVGETIIFTTTHHITLHHTAPYRTALHHTAPHPTSPSCLLHAPPYLHPRVRKHCQRMGEAVSTRGGAQLIVLESTPWKLR